MIYLDNAATGWPKPFEVINATKNAFMHYGANPGRGGYKMSLKTAEAIYSVRKRAAQLFGISGAENVVFTPNCTAALNTAIKCFLPPLAHVVVSDREHNSVMRPLEEMQKEGLLTYNVAPIGGDPQNAELYFEKTLTQRTKMLICTHRSNADGETMPIIKIGRLAARKGLLFCVDAAQTAGSEDIDIESMGINLLAIPGHKGLNGPAGTGMLIINRCKPLGSVIQGGTGSMSSGYDMPDFLPDIFEAGTMNVPGVIGLGKGLEFVAGQGAANIGRYEKRLCDALAAELEKISKVTVYRPKDPGNIVLFNISGLSSEATANMLSEADICVRAGLHCAPSAHRLLGTLPDGATRISAGVFNDYRQIMKCAEAIKNIAKQNDRE